MSNKPVISLDRDTFKVVSGVHYEAVASGDGYICFTATDVNQTYTVNLEMTQHWADIYIEAAYNTEATKDNEFLKVGYFDESSRAFLSEKIKDLGIYDNYMEAVYEAVNQTF